MVYTNGVGEYGTPQYPRVGHNPGRDEAIAAIILAFFFPLLGLILAILSRRRSARYGWPHEGLATAALWISVALLALSLLIPLLLHGATGFFNNWHLGPWYF